MRVITPETESNFAETVLEFCRFLRQEGIDSGVNDSVVALEAAAIVGVQDREVLRMALRAVLCSSKDDWDLFDDLFWIFWRDSDSAAGRVLPIAIGERHLAPPIPVGREPVTCRMDPSGELLLVANQESNDLAVIRLRTSSLLTMVPVGAHPTDIVSLLF